MPGEHYHFCSHSLTKTINLLMFVMKKALTKPTVRDLKALCESSVNALPPAAHSVIVLLIEKRATSAIARIPENEAKAFNLAS